MGVPVRGAGVAVASGLLGRAGSDNLQKKGRPRGSCPQLCLPGHGGEQQPGLRLEDPRVFN